LLSSSLMQKKSAKSYCDKFDSRVLKQEEKLFKTRSRATKGRARKGSSTLSKQRPTLTLIFRIWRLSTGGFNPISHRPS
jgi:hypothetical protein